MRNAQADYRSRRRATRGTSRIRPRADGISQQPRLYRTALLESRDFAADKRCTGGNPARVARIGKAACTTCFFAEPLIPTATPFSLPWERARERATSRKAYIWAVRSLGQIAEIRRMPSPQPSPTGEGADCGRFKRCRSSEKECPKYQQQEFFR